MQLPCMYMYFQTGTQVACIMADITDCITISYLYDSLTDTPELIKDMYDMKDTFQGPN